MSLVIGQMTLNGTDEQNAAMRPLAEQTLALFGTRLRPVRVDVRPRALMPRYRDPRPTDGPTDGRAEGYWRVRPHVIWIADDVFPDADTPADLIDKTLGHEVLHWWFDDAATPADKQALLGYLEPEPENYADTIVNGRDRGYPALPEECICVWGSAAVYGFFPPAYVTLYKRRIPVADFPKARAIFLATPPPDPCASLREQVEQLTAELATANQRIKDKDAKFQEGLLL